MSGPRAPQAGRNPAASPAAALLGEAARLLRAGQLAAAVPVLRQAAIRDPANPAIHHDLGAALLNLGRAPEAAASLANALRLNPKLANAHHLLGVALWRQGRAAEAVAAQQAAVTLAPRHADAQFHLGDLLLERRRMREAAAAFDQAAAAAGATSQGRAAAARALMARNRPDEAIAALHRARALDPRSIMLARLLANTLALAGRFAEAEDARAAVLALDPADAESWYAAATLRKLAPSDRPLIEQMEARARSGLRTERDRMTLHFALGKAYDDLGEYAAAIGHFDAANRIRAGMGRLNRGSWTRRIDSLIAASACTATAESSNPGDERAVLILGMPRSGTTLVEQILSSHNRVKAGDELGYWSQHDADSVALSLAPARLRALADGYRATLNDISADAGRVTDKNPFNFLRLGLIRRALPNAFIIHCRRHPVDTCLSIYMTHFAPLESMFMGNRDDLVFYFREYLRLMRHWRAALAGPGFLEVDYEALIEQREEATRRLVSFCRLEWDAACLHPEANRRAVATASVWQARQPVYRSSLARWRNYEPWLGPLAELMNEVHA